ncbi:Protein kinase domain [Trinorchestia longiramus]|nr:Protein kinase domain [Trinorchestia longiramus]
MSSDHDFGNSIEEYSVHNKIGVGGFASVYQATCRRTGWEVAIKQISKDQIKERGLSERVRQEVSIHCTLNHPSILKLYTCFEDARYVYLVLELCQGGELQKVLKGKPLQEEQCVRYLRQVVSGMLYLHNLSIMHRDLTLSNLLLAADGTLRIADFGLATQLTRPDDRHTTMCGTPNYMSPEVATRSSHGLESDVWSLGVMLYTMMVGRPPFHTHAVRATITKALLEQCQIPPHLSPDCQDLISRCLQKNFRERIKLQDVLHHPFLRLAESEPGMTRAGSSMGGSDSGLYTMTTTGHNLTSRPNTLHAITENETSGCNARSGGSSNCCSSSRGCDSEVASHGRLVNSGHHSSRSAGDTAYNTNANERIDFISKESGALSDRNIKYGAHDTVKDNYSESIHSHPSSDSRCIGPQVCVAEGVYRPHDPGGSRPPLHSNSPPVKIKSQFRPESNPHMLASMQTLKRKFTGLPPLPPVVNPASLGMHLMPPPFTHPGLARQAPLHSTGYNDRSDEYVDQKTDKKLAPGNELFGGARTRSRSYDRSDSRRRGRAPGRSLERFSRNETDVLLDTPRDVLQGELLPSNRQWESSNSVQSSRSGTSQDKGMPGVREYSCCRSVHHRSDCSKFRDHNLGFSLERLNCYERNDDCAQLQSGCNSSKHSSNCEGKHRSENPNRFMQEYGSNKNTFGHANSGDLAPADHHSNNLLDDIALPRFTPRINLPPDAGPGADNIGQDSLASQRASSRKGSNLSHGKENSTHKNRDSASDRNKAAEKVNVGSLSQQCSALNTKRLRPTRQTTKNAILHILASGEVCIEFVKRKRGQELVMDACRISEDGMRVVLYSINNGAGGPVQDEPYSVPSGGAEAFYSYETLPSSCWKKYIYASRFVDVVKTKTPKITYYSPQAKCILMENSPDADFEATFFESGVKVLLSGSSITVTEGDGQVHSASRSSTPHLPTSILHYHTHAKTIHDHCLYLERVLADVEQKTGHDSFPLTVGRKPGPAVQPAKTSSREAITSARCIHSKNNKKAPEEDKENTSPASVQSEMPQIYSALNEVVGPYEASVGSSSPALRQVLAPRSMDAPQQPRPSYIRPSAASASDSKMQNFIPGVGWMKQEEDGRVSVEFLDGSEVTVDCRTGASAVVAYRSSRSAALTSYNTSAALPRPLRDKLATVKDLMATLMQHKL